MPIVVVERVFTPETERQIDEAARAAWRALLDYPVELKAEAVKRLEVLVAEEEHSWLRGPEGRQ
jgi:hypothetical protein